jgi:hypothetical protein
MFVRGVVRDEVEKDADPEPVRLLDEPIEDLEIAEPPVDPAVISDVISVVRERGDVER